MSVRGIIKQRLRDLSIIGKSAKEKGKQDIMLDVVIRTNELEILLKQMKKR